MPIGIIKYGQGYRYGQGHHYGQPPNLPAPPLPPPVIQERKKHMDFVPKQRDARYLWYKNLSANIVAEAVKFGLTNAEALAAKALADAILAKYDGTDTAKNALDAARQMEKTTEDPNLRALRLKFRNWKTLTGWPASGSEAVLRLKGSELVFDPGTFKPVITVTLAVNKVQIDFDKMGVDGMNIYCRLRGTATWRRLAFDSHAPYFDTAPLANPAVPEVREYKAIGVLNDEEIGVESDIVSVTFAG